MLPPNANSIALIRSCITIHSILFVAHGCNDKNAQRLHLTTSLTAPSLGKHLRFLSIVPLNAYLALFCSSAIRTRLPPRASSAGGADGEFLKGISKKEWDSVKRQYAANTLPKSHPVRVCVLASVRVRFLFCSGRYNPEDQRNTWPSLSRLERPLVLQDLGPGQ